MADEPINNNESDNKSQTEDSRKREAPFQPRPRQQGGPRRSGPQGRYASSTSRGMGFRSRRRKVCAFCVDKVNIIDWKDLDTLRRFIGDDGSIRARRKTGTCAKHQRRLALAVKRARHMAMLPFTGEHIRLAGKS